MSGLAVEAWKASTRLLIDVPAELTEQLDGKSVEWFEKVTDAEYRKP